MYCITPRESQRITALIRDPQFCLDVANLMKPPGKQYKPEDHKEIALSQPRLYAVIASSKTLVNLGYAPSLQCALEMLIIGDDNAVVAMSNDIAHWTWASVEPTKGFERMCRPAFCDTGELPADEVEKDRVRIVETAKLLLSRLFA